MSLKKLCILFPLLHPAVCYVFMCFLVSMCCKLDVEKCCVAVATKMKGSRRKKLERTLQYRLVCILGVIISVSWFPEVKKTTTFDLILKIIDLASFHLK